MNNVTPDQIIAAARERWPESHYQELQVAQEWFRYKDEPIREGMIGWDLRVYRGLDNTVYLDAPTLDQLLEQIKGTPEQQRSKVAES